MDWPFVGDVGKPAVCHVEHCNGTDTGKLSPAAALCKSLGRSIEAGPSASAKMPIEHPIRWEPMAHRTGCPIGTDGRPMGILARLHRAPPGTTRGSHETFLSDSSFLTNQKRGILELLHDA